MKRYEIVMTVRDLTDGENLYKFITYPSQRQIENEDYWTGLLEQQEINLNDVRFELIENEGDI